MSDISGIKYDTSTTNVRTHAFYIRRESPNSLPKLECATVMELVAKERDDLHTELTATQEKLAAAEAERDRVLTENDKLKVQMRGWHDQVYVEGIQMRALPDTTFGEPVDPIPAITPKRLTDLLDRLAAAEEATAPVRDDAWARRLLEYAAKCWCLESNILAYDYMLAAFNTQDKP